MSDKQPLPREVRTNPTERDAVYLAIDTERNYQDSFVLPENQYYATHTLGEFILMLGQYADQAREKWTHHNGSKDGYTDALHEVRKIAALAVRCMEQHGAPQRLAPPDLHRIESIV